MDCNARPETNLARKRLCNSRKTSHTWRMRLRGARRSGRCISFVPDPQRREARPIPATRLPTLLRIICGLHESSAARAHAAHLKDDIFLDLDVMGNIGRLSIETAGGKD